MRGFEYHDLEVTYVKQSEKAVLVEYACTEYWIPKSVLSHSIREMSDWDYGDNICVQVAEWFVEKNIDL